MTPSLYAAGAPLTASNGKTNHPVLFVHGWNANMSSEWGAVPVKEDGSSCTMSMDDVIISNVRSLWIDVEVEGWFEHNHADLYFLVDYYIKKKCGSTEENKYVGTSSPQFVFSRDCGSLNKDYDEYCSAELNDPQRNITTSIIDFNSSKPSIYVDFKRYDIIAPGGNMWMTSSGQIPAPGISTNQQTTYLRPTGIYHSAYINQETIDKIRNDVNVFIKRNAGGVFVNDSTKAYPPEKSNLIDKAGFYSPLSAPNYIQTSLGLNPPSSGLDNGLYFYNAKQISQKATAADCQYSSTYSKAGDVTAHQVNGTAGGNGVQFNINQELVCKLPSMSYSRPVIHGQSLNLVNYQTNSSACMIDEFKSSLEVDPITGIYSFTCAGKKYDNIPLTVNSSNLQTAQNGISKSIVDANGYVYLSEGHPVPWSEFKNGKPGQAQQLYDRALEVMDQYYGKGKWQNKADAGIDLVGYSQGGLTIRSMAYELKKMSKQGQSVPLLDKINRVVTFNTPNLGSAFGTSLARLNSTLNHPQFKNQQFRLLGKHLNRLTQESVVLTDVAGDDVIDVNYWDDLDVSLRAEGPFLGPYNISGSITGFNPVLGLNPIITGVVDSDNLTSSGFLWTNLNLNFNINNLGGAGTDMESLRKTIDSWRASGAHLSWSDDQGWGVNSNQGQLSNLMLNAKFPLNSQDEKIPTSFIYAPSSGALYHSYKNMISDYMTQKVCAGIKGNKFNMTTTCNRLKNLFMYDIEYGANWFGQKSAVGELISDLDQEWSLRGDGVVEEISQHSMYPGSDFEKPTAKFNPHKVQKEALVHFEGMLPANASGHLSAYNQGQDLLTVLQKDQSTQTGTVHIGPQAMALSVAPSSANTEKVFNLSTDLMDRIEGKSLSTIRDKNYVAALRYVRGAPTDKNGVELKYYFKADERSNPQVTMTGPGTLTVRKMEGSLYEAFISAPNELIPTGTTSALWQLTFSNGDGSQWVPTKDWSAPLGKNWRANRMIAITGGAEYLDIGSKPDTTSLNELTIAKAALGYSKERSTNPTQSLPSVGVKNVGPIPLHGFHVIYTFRASKPPVLNSWWWTDKDQSTMTLHERGNNYWSVLVSYPNKTLNPGDSIQGIDFELNYQDWSPWNLSDDPSYHTDRPGDYLANAQIVVLDSSGSAIGGVNQEPLFKRLNEYHLHTEAADHSTSADHRIIDFRVRNTGTNPKTGLRFQYYFNSLIKPLPNIQLVNAPSCTYQLIPQAIYGQLIDIRCPNAIVESGAVWPDLGDQGIRLEFDYGNGTPVTLENDYSYSGITNTWAKVPLLMIRDLDGYLFWGSFKQW